ncbi:MAG: riboflavin synthase [Gemmatimonadetes bacterium]|nr:riboflavin synthase [Gemmatimonadota bacterium]
MFTGLITDIGTLERTSDTEAGREFRIACAYSDLALGESIAVNGACLTVREAGSGWFTAAAVQTTLSRTAMAGWMVGRRLNLERALRASDRLGGHFVLGHVDAVAEVTDIVTAGDARLIEIALTPALAPLVVPHGSIAVDGVSLTINELREPDAIQLSLIEFTLRHTTLAELAIGDTVHVEADVLGKYAQRLAAGSFAAATHDQL